MYHLNRREILYKLGKSFCEKYQKKNKEKEEKDNIDKISFENQMKPIKRIKINKNRKCCHVHSKIYNERHQVKEYCSKCGKACCNMHYAFNIICYLCDGFEKKRNI